MAEECRVNTFQIKGNVFGFEPFVASIAIGGHHEGLLAVVAGPTSLAFFHRLHGYRFFSAGDGFAVMAALAGYACLGYVARMTEDRIAKSLNPVADITGLALVTFNTVFVGGHA